MRKQWLVASMLLLGDLAALYGGLFLTLILRYGTELARPWEIHKIPFTIIFLVWLLIFFMVGLYEQGSWNARRTVVERILRSMVAASIAAVVLFYLVETFGITPKTNLIIQTLFSLLLIIGWPFITLGIILSTPHEAFNYKDYRARPGDGPIFFRQKRVGKNGRIFDFIKFRSQRLGSEKMSEVKETANDPRQYPVGKILRAFYLDELPQIINVLKGEMSLIGPRPERPEYVTKLKEAIPFYEVRLLVPPGVTGWAEVNMKNDAAVKD